MPTIGDKLVKIINESLCTGEFPETWKHSIIKPNKNKTKISKDIEKTYDQ